MYITADAALLLCFDYLSMLLWSNKIQSNLWRKYLCLFMVPGGESPTMMGEAGLQVAMVESQMITVSTAKIKQSQQTESRARVWTLKTLSQCWTSSKKFETSLWTIPPPGNQMFKDRRQFSFKPPHPLTSSFCFKVLLCSSNWPQTCGYPLLSASSKLRSWTWATSPNGILFLRICVLIQMCGDVNTCTCGYMFIRYQGRILPVSLYLYHLMFFETWFLTEPRDYDFV